MDSLTQTLELCRRVTAGYRPALRNSPVAKCVSPGWFAYWKEC